MLPNSIILIGGAPTAGKSYLARKLAEELHMPWISTDTIRGMMQKLLHPKDYPVLFTHAEPTTEMAVDFLTQNTAKQIVEFQNKESEAVWKGVEALIDTDYVWGSYIIEGVAVLPKQVFELIKTNTTVKSVFLIDSNKDRIKEVIYTRGLWDDAQNYPDHVKDKEVAWVLAFNDWLTQECATYNLPLVDIGNRNDYIDKVKELVS